MMFFLPCLILAQQAKVNTENNIVIDSLLLILKTDKQDTLSVNIQHALTSKYLNLGNYHEAMQNAIQALQKAEKLFFKNGIATSYSLKGNIYEQQGFFEEAMDSYLKSLKICEEMMNKKGVANANSNIGSIEEKQGNYGNAMNSHLKSLEIFTEIKDLKGIARAYNNVGIIYSDLGDFEKATSNYLKALKNWEKIGDKKGVANCFNNIGIIYLNQGNYEKCLENYLKSLKLREEIGNKSGIGASFNNIGNVYQNLEKYEDALEYHMKSLKIMQEIGDQQGIARSHNNIGNTYLNQGNYKNALENQLKAVKINETIGDKRGTAIAYSNVGNIYMQQGNFEEAINYNTKSLLLNKKIGYKVGIKDAYYCLSEIYDKKGYFNQALIFRKLYSLTKDTMLNVENSKQIAEMNTKYDSEKKDKELIKKDAEINKQLVETEKQNLQRNAFIIGFALVLLLAFFIYNGYHQKKNANELLEEKNSLIENQKKLVDEKNIKITDSINYAKRIQQAILPSREMIEFLIPESFVFFKPKAIVSGDFYWIHPVDDNKVLLAVADCTGHGVPGALMSIMGFNLLEQIVKEHFIQEPAKILNDLSNKITESLRQKDEFGSVKDGMDIALCKIDFQNLELEFSGAHNSLYLIRNGKLNEIKADRRSVGVSSSKPGLFSNHKLKLEKGDCLYIFSDGFADQKGGMKNEKFFYKPFRELLIKNHQMEMVEQERILENVISEWKSDKEQIDDMLVIGLRI